MTLFLTRLSRPPAGGSRSEGSGCGGGLEVRGVGRYGGSSLDDLIDGAGVVAGVVRNVRVEANVEVVVAEVADVGASQSRSVCASVRMNQDELGENPYHRQRSYLEEGVARNSAVNS